MGLDLSPSNPLIPGLPTAESTFQNKYAEISPILSSLPPGIRNTLVDMDLQRVTRGQRPLSIPETTAVLQTALNPSEPATPPPERGTSPLDIVGNIAKDVGTIAKALPRLPGTLYQEATQLPQAPAEVATSLASGDLAGALEAPGVRMLPGAFVGAQLARGDLGTLARHPGFAALDVAPFAARPAARAARQTGQRLLATPTGQNITSSRVGQFARRSFGPRARDISRAWDQMRGRIAERFKAKSLDTGADIDAANVARQFTEKYRSAVDEGRLPQDRLEELTAQAELDPRRIRFSDDPLTADLERGLLADWREVNDAMFRAGYSTENLHNIVIDGTPEVYDRATGNRILRTRRSRDSVAELVDVRRSILTPSEPSDLLTKIRRTVYNPNASNTRKLVMLDGYIRAFGNTGADNTRLLNSLRSVKTSKNFDEVLAALDDTSTTQIRPIPDDFTRPLRNFQRDPQALRLADAIDNGNWSHALRLTRSIQQRKTPLLPNLDDLAEAIKTRSKAVKFLDTTKMLKSSERLLKRLQRQTRRIEETTPPARFVPRLQEEMARKIESGKVAVGDRLVFTDNPNLPHVLQLIKERNFNLLEGFLEGFDEVAFRRLQRETNSTWLELRNEGLDPIYLHHVTPQQAKLLDYPRPTKSNPSQIKQRTNDYTPYIPDATVAVSAQALEWLSRRASVEFAEWIGKQSWAKSLRELQEELLPQARLRAERQGLGPEGVQGELAKLIDREWSQYNPNNLFEFPSKRLNVLRDQQLYIPKSARGVIEQFRSGGAAPELSTALDPIMGVFRASVLALSPRWHVNNILGGGVLLTARTGPSVFRHLRTAREAARTGIDPRTGTQLPDEIRLALGARERIDVEFHKRAGATAARLFKDLPVPEAARKLGRGVSNVAERSFQFNSLVDDTYRVMAYLEGYDTSITKGLSREAAQQAGETLARKVLQEWAAYTPFERTLLRSVFPFYSWAAHILRYSFSYPVDHPFRTSVVQSLAKTAADDLEADGLPERFLNALFLGTPNEDGSITAVNFGYTNPFADVANYATMAGWMSALNPIISTGLEAAGIDPISGQPELYPELTYDPDSGRLQAETSNPLLGLAGNIVPQFEALQMASGFNREFQELAQTDTAAARRMLLSRFGFPTMVREMNPAEERMRSELSRFGQQRSVLNEAFRTGDTGEARKWPGLRATLEATEQAPEEAVSPFRLPEGISPGQRRIVRAQERLLGLNLPSPLS